MIRHLAPLPASWDLAAVSAATATAFPAALGCNEVDDDGTSSWAVYLSDEATDAALTTWRAAVASTPATASNPNPIDVPALLAAARAHLPAASAATRNVVGPLLDVLDALTTET